MNWKVKTLKVSATCLDRLAKISWILKNNGNLFTMFVNQMDRAYTDKTLKTLCIHE